MLKRTICTLLLLVGITVLIYRTTHQVVFVSPRGNDANPGTRDKPFQHISFAYRTINFGGTIYLLPGIYREEVDLPTSPLPRASVFIRGMTIADEHATIVGSEPASKTSWIRCTAATCPTVRAEIRSSVFVGDWHGAQNPTILTQTTNDGDIHELVLARSPNSYLTDPNKYHQYWWTADETNDSPRSLVDTENDPGLQKGNLTTAPGITGGTAFIMDGNDRCGIFMYERRIVSHDPTRGQIIFDRPVGALTYGIQENGVGAFTKYYVENAIGLLDTPGEWFYDAQGGKLYVWPLTDTNPSQGFIEIGQRSTGIRLNASDIHIDNVVIRGINDAYETDAAYTGAIVVGSIGHTKINKIALTNLTIQYAGNGVSVQPQESSSVHTITIQHADLSHTTKSPIAIIARTHLPTNIRNVSITDSSVHNAATRYNEPGINLIRVSDADILHNHVFDNTSYGIHLTSYEKNTGSVNNILVADNRIERVCQNASSCAALKFFGGEFTHTVADHNNLSDNLGWSYCQEQTSHKKGFADGVFVSNASGVTVSNNNAVNNSQFGYTVYPRQIAATHNTFYRNRAVNSSVGIRLETAAGETDNDPNVYATRHDFTVIKQNVFSDTGVGISLDPAHPSLVSIDANTYIHTGIDMIFRGTHLSKITDIRRLFPFWETHTIDTP